MTISNQNTYSGYIGDGVATTFVFPMQTYSATDIVVYEWVGGVPTQRTDVTVVLNTNQSSSPGGTITFNTPPVNGVQGTVFRDVPLVQETRYIPGDAFPSESHERQLDLLAMMAQQQQTAIDQSVKVFGGDGPLLFPFDGRLAYIHWNADGNLVNGWTENDMDNRFAAIVHDHEISDVNGLQDALDDNLTQADLDASQAAQDTIINANTGKADANTSAIAALDVRVQNNTAASDDNAADIATKAEDADVVKLAGDQTVGGAKTFVAVPHTNAAPQQPSDITNKGYVDEIYNSLVGVIFRGTIDLTAGDAALPGSPNNGDRYYVGVGGTVTVSDGSGPAAPTVVNAGDSITWSAADNYWLHTIPAGSSGAASNTSYIAGANVILTGGNLQITTDQTETALGEAVAHASNTSDPHNVTQTQVGLSNVNNTSDANKPISSATQTALDDKSDDGHTHTSDEVGLANIVDDASGVAITGRATQDTAAASAADLIRFQEAVNTGVPRRLGAGVGVTGTVREITGDGVTFNINPELGSVQWGVHNGPSFTFTLSAEARDLDATWSMELWAWVQANTTIVSRTGLASVNIWTPGGQSALQGGFYLMSLRKLQALDPPVVILTWTGCSAVAAP